MTHIAARCQALVTYSKAPGPDERCRQTLYLEGSKESTGMRREVSSCTKVGLAKDLVVSGSSVCGV